MVEAVIRETPLLLKVENEGPDFMLTDLGHICALSSRRNEQVLKITQAVGDYSRGGWAFPLGGRAKLVTMK
jgi:hypothetical protein